MEGCAPILGSFRLILKFIFEKWMKIKTENEAKMAEKCKGDCQKKN
jgi:hypothetical protein